MRTGQTTRDVVERIVVMPATEREKAIALHDHVRDNVKFGFNKYFDAAQPDYTLACGYGHCNPKSRLMVSLLRAIGLEAHQHFVVIPNDILKDALPRGRRWLLPPELSHSYVEVKVEGTWYAIDSYIVDTALLKAAQARLSKEGRSLGYGVRADSTNVWNGQRNAFSQFDRDTVIEDHGRVENLEAYFRDRKYRNQKFGLRFNTMFKVMGDVVLPAINAHIESIRTSFIE
jgi:transglutaminase-like putative cysteine protease